MMIIFLAWFKVDCWASLLKDDFMGTAPLLTSQHEPRSLIFPFEIILPLKFDISDSFLILGFGSGPSIH